MKKENQNQQYDVKYMTLQDLCNYLGISERTLYRYNKLKLIPHRKINNRIRYDLDEVMDALRIPKKPTKSIDKVTVDRLDVVLRMCNIQLSKVIINRVIDCVRLIEEKGGGVTLEDAIDLQAEWEKKPNNDDLEVRYETPFHT